MNPRTLLAVTLTGLALVGCGYKGSLTLPEKPGEVTTRPGPGGGTPPATTEGSQPTQPPTPSEAVPPPGAATRTGDAGG